MHLKPETIKYNKTVINRYSKTCRTNFGDNKCKVDKNLYTRIYKVKEILKESLRIVELDKENGYYNGGHIIFGDNLFSSKILSNFSDFIILQDIIPDYAKDAEEVKIIVGCDKNFITCCNKFNNAINFRGEPLIPDKEFINLV
ncbi:MAG: phage BR0599 family protein [Rickettsia endosymbiont of Argas persicus]